MNIKTSILLPNAPARNSGCPKCGHSDFNGRKVMGVITFTCANKECRNKWSGGLRSEFSSTENVPQLPNTDVVVTLPVRNKEGVVLDYQEILTPQPKSPSFRGGAKVKSED